MLKKILTVFFAVVVGPIWLTVMVLAWLRYLLSVRKYSGQFFDFLAGFRATEITTNNNCNGRRNNKGDDFNDCHFVPTWEMKAAIIADICTVAPKADNTSGSGTPAQKV